MYDINNDHDSLISIRKNFNEYEIELTIKEDSCLNILIKNDLCCYENNFNENYLQQKFKLNESINNIYNNMCDNIKKLKLNDFKRNLKFRNNKLPHFKTEKSYLDNVKNDVKELSKKKIIIYYIMQLNLENIIKIILCLLMAWMI